MTKKLKRKKFRKFKAGDTTALYVDRNDWQNWPSFLSTVATKLFGMFRFCS